MGGNLFSDKATGVKQSDVKEVQELAQKLLISLGVNSSNIAFTGSAGMKHPDVLSGDIDVAFVLPSDCTFEDFRDRMKEKAHDVRWSKRYNIISTVLSYSAGNAQVDFMPVEDLTFARWGMYSDHYTRTKYKSALRNDIIRAALEVKTKVVIEETEDFEPIVWEQVTMIPSRGLFAQRWSRASKRKNYFLKNPVMIEERFVTDSIPEVLNRALGVKWDKVMETTCYNAEEAMELLKDKPYKDEVFRIARDKAIEGGYDFPEEWKKL